MPVESSLGTSEDLLGAPSVGPSGKLLRSLLAEAGLDMDRLYVTNTALQVRAARQGAPAQARFGLEAGGLPPVACGRARPGDPHVIVALGAMAAPDTVRASYRVTTQRGQWQELGPHARGLATWHPSAVLRMRSPDREQARAQMLADLSLVAAAVGATEEK